MRVAAAATGLVRATAVRYSVEVCVLDRKLRSSLVTLVGLIGEMTVAEVRAVVAVTVAAPVPEPAAALCFVPGIGNGEPDSG